MNKTLLILAIAFGLSQIANVQKNMRLILSYNVMKMPF